MRNKIIKILIVIIIMNISIALFIGLKVLINKKFVENYPNSDQEFRLLLLSAFNIYEPYIAHYNYGNYYYNEELYQEAIEKYKNALKYDIPKERVCDVEINLSLALIKQSNMERKRSDMIKLLQEAKEHLKDCINLEITIPEEEKNKDFENTINNENKTDKEKEENRNNEENNHENIDHNDSKINKGNKTIENKESDDSKSESENEMTQSNQDKSKQQSGGDKVKSQPDKESETGKEGGGGSDGTANGAGEGDGNGSANGIANGNDDGGKGEGLTSGNASNANGRGTSSNIGSNQVNTLEEKRQDAIKISNDITLILDELLNRNLDLNLPGEDIWEKLDESVKIQISNSEIAKESCLKERELIFKQINPLTGKEMIVHREKTLGPCEDPLPGTTSPSSPTQSNPSGNGNPPTAGTGSGGTTVGDGDRNEPEPTPGLSGTW